MAAYGRWKIFYMVERSREGERVRWREGGREGEENRRERERDR